MKKTIKSIVLLLIIVFLLVSCGNKSYVVFNYNCNGTDYHKCELKNNKLNCSVETPSCGEYKFKGWFRANEYNNPVDLNGTFNKNEIIYARWEKGNGIIEPSSSQEPISTIITPGIIDIPSSSKEEPSSSQQQVTPPTPVNPPTPEETYTISFNLNGGSGGQTTSINGVKYNQTLPSISSTKPTRGGHVFTGWYDSTTGGTQYYNSSNTGVRKYDKKSNITLYAGWKACPVGQYAPSGATSCSPCTGNTYTNKTGQSSCLACGTGQTVNSNHTGCSSSIYKITLNNQGAATSGTSEIYLEYNTGWYSNTSMTTPITKITIPTKVGYTFKGYYTSPNGEGSQIIDSSGMILSGKTKAFASNGTLYANWKINVLSIRYNGNGGVWNSTNPAYGVNSSGTVILESTSDIYAHHLNYGANLTSSGLVDHNGSWFGWKNDGHIVEKGKEYYLQNGSTKTELDQAKVYSAIELSRYAGCDLSKANCTITVKVNWKQGEIIRLATFNVGYFACGSSKISCSPTNDQLINLIKNNKIDIVGTQEARNNGYNTNRIETIGDKSGLKYKYISKPANVNAIISKFEFKSKSSTKMSCGETRSLDKVVININGVNVSYYNTHLGLRTCNEEHFQKVADIVSADPNPIIITADYNHIKITRFEKYFFPLGFEMAAYDTSTNNMWGKQSYCDSVLVNSKGHIDIVSSNTLEVYGTYSDHNLVYADLLIH